MIEKFNRSKTLFYLLVLIIIVSLALVFRVTYAFLENYVGEGSSSDVKVNIKNDFLEFEPGGALMLEVSAEKLAQTDGKDIVVESHPKANFYDTKSGNKRQYYTYLSIKNNNFTYTSSNTPEIILTITGPDNQEITSVNGLTRVTEQGRAKNISGFDITTYQKADEPILIDERDIVSAGTEVTTDTWTFKLTYVNLESDQSANLNKTLDINVVMLDHEITTAEEKAQY